MENSCGVKECIASYSFREDEKELRSGVPAIALAKAGGVKACHVFYSFRESE